MTVADAIANALKKEGVKYLFAYPVNPLIEAAAKLDIRPIIVRQERIGLHMADAIGRLSSGKQIGVFCMQHGPGTENAYGGVAQAYGESSPILVLPAGYNRELAHINPNFSSYLNFQHITKSCETLITSAATEEVIRRAFTQVRNGRPGPVLVEIPVDLFGEELPQPFNYTPVPTTRSAPDPEAVEKASIALLEAKRPVIYAGQGIHYAQAWDSLKTLAELLEAPVATSLSGKSAFPETHPLSLGAGGLAVPQTVFDFIKNADLILGIGCSFTRSSFAIHIPLEKPIIHATLDPSDINKDVKVSQALVGDANLTLNAINQCISDLLRGKPRKRTNQVTEEIATIRKSWMQRWKPKLTDTSTPFSPYRVIRDLMQTVDTGNTIITHDAGSPRDQLAPFWASLAPLSYIGWGKTTQLGYGLGLAMGAKLACPDKLCINVWGDAAIGFTGMDFETAVRERIPILSILFNNLSMAIELKIMPVSTEKFRSTDISGNYSQMANAFGGYGERIDLPENIIPAIRRGIEKTEEGVPVLLEFMTSKEVEVSKF
ncbi:MAG: Acetolactate synthase isozyme 3 large subunit [Candidatus Moanabacter tarae]|uniref:Acetolactate synthase isozyme 3 large subunit n=1 Tax=Candidatus Moanibacter tarae TaxID=2200854 RepID=A0A2Z4AED1_9BACT|nr:MAG: Acetolactate synthase isozyme 3 large subunit [Candidatus Moanabacter tarae]|tara:strand:- start:1872 stop:3506 length:1635 start_codon:yes stop_codon:yes gene_type:complete